MPYVRRDNPMQPAAAASTRGSIAFSASEPRSTRRAHTPSENMPDRVVVRIMMWLLVSGVLLQTFVLPVGGGEVFVDLPILYIAMGALLLSRRLVISPFRVILFILTFGTAVLMQTFVVRDASLSSMFLAIAIYASILGFVPATQVTYMRILMLFQYVVLSICVLVYLDLALQLVHIDMPDIRSVVPPRLMNQSYNYLQPVLYGSSIMKPNAFFMLEASFTSQFIALGLVIELAFFQRPLLIGAMAIGLLATFAFTGILLLAVSLPLLLGRRYWRRALVFGIVGLPLLLAGAYVSGWLDVVAARMPDGGAVRQDSSFNQRFVLPYTAMWDLVRTGTPSQLMAGLGAGATMRLTENAEYNATPRAFIEYGFVFCLLFTIFYKFLLFLYGGSFYRGLDSFYKL